MLNTKKIFATTGISAVLAMGFCYGDSPEDENFSGTATQVEASDNDTVNNQVISEAFGHFIGRNLNSPGVNFDLDSIIKGIRKGAAGEAAPMSDQDYEQAMTKLQERAFETMASENLDTANKFMEKNIDNEEVVEIESGKLQYLTLSEGEGDKVQAHSTPLIHYTGKYLDGTVFGCSEEVGGPITIPLDQTIPGFSKGLLGMREGEKRRLFIHPDLGYGTLGNLPPNALLVFDIEIIKADSREDEVMTSEDEDDDDDMLALIDDEDDDRLDNHDEDDELQEDSLEQ